MFKILMLSKINIILTTFVNNTNNFGANEAYYTIFYKKTIYKAVKIGHGSSYFLCFYEHFHREVHIANELITKFIIFGSP